MADRGHGSLGHARRARKGTNAACGNTQQPTAGPRECPGAAEPTPTVADTSGAPRPATRTRPARTRRGPPQRVDDNGAPHAGSEGGQWGHTGRLTFHGQHRHKGKPAITCPPTHSAAMSKRRALVRLALHSPVFVSTIAVSMRRTQRAPCRTLTRSTVPARCVSIVGGRG